MVYNKINIQSYLYELSCFKRRVKWSKKNNVMTIIQLEKSIMRQIVILKKFHF